MGALDAGLFDPGGFIPGYSYDPGPATTIPIASTTSEMTPWWSGLITDVMKLTPNIISASQGHTYASTPYGQSSYGYSGGGGGGGVYAGGSFLGASGFGQISGTTLLLIGLAAILLLRRK